MAVCDQCGRTSKRMFRLDNGDASETLCLRCHNNRWTELIGTDDFNDYVKDLYMEDVDGNQRHFKIDKIVFPMGIEWCAEEIKEDDTPGYRFSVRCEFEDDPKRVLQKLYQKIAKGLSVKYVEEGEYFGLCRMTEDELAGYIVWDEETGGMLPRLVIDGKEYSWAEVGRMLMTYEGFDFRLKILERTR